MGGPSVTRAASTRRRLDNHGARRVVDWLAAAASVGFRPTRRNVIHWASWAVTLTILLAATAILFDGHVYEWEIDVVRWAQDVDYPEWMLRITGDTLTDSDTILGASLISGVVLVLWLLRQRIEAALVVLSVPLHILGNFPKALVDRQSPSEAIDGLMGVGGFRSFPSGHAEYAITFYGFLVYIALLHIDHRIARAALVSLWIILVLTVGFYRLSVGEHWPLDVLVGYVVGIGLLSGLIWLHRSLREASAGESEQAPSATTGTRL
jgi:undecaprenyl-diphosphatase